MDIVISEGAERREVRSLRPKNDDRIISRDDCWANVARNFANQPEKSLVVSFIDRGIRMRQGSATKLRQRMQPVEHRKAQGMAASRMPERRMKMHAERAVATMHERMHQAKEWVMGVAQRMTWHKGHRPEQHPDISQHERDAARQRTAAREAPAQARAPQQSPGQDLEL